MLQKLTLNEIKLLGATHFHGVLTYPPNIIEYFKIESDTRIKYWDTQEEYWEDVSESYFKDYVKYLFILEDIDE